ncbi:MAG: hypothetical protein IH898_03925, partial [Planctomycetes bacterium]|nr:hypothetical protein [Planctomycetota bacterium]
MSRTMRERVRALTPRHREVVRLVSLGCTLTQIATILDERVNALVNAAADERPRVLDDSNKKLASVLSEDQKQTFAALVEGGKLRFNFRQQDWPDVLDWFARQADLSLVMDTAPPGKFTYSDTKN